MRRESQYEVVTKWSNHMPGDGHRRSGNFHRLQLFERWGHRRLAANVHGRGRVVWKRRFQVVQVVRLVNKLATGLMLGSKSRNYVCMFSFP